MNRFNIFLSFTTLLTFWGNEIGGCSKVDTRTLTELSKDLFLSEYAEVDSSKIEIKSINEKTTFNTGRKKSTNLYQIDVSEAINYHYLEQKESYLNNEISKKELKLEAGLYSYYENEVKVDTYDLNGAEKFVNDLMDTYLSLYKNMTSYNEISLLDSEKYSFYTYEEENSFKIVEKETNYSYEINKYGYITNIYYPTKEEKEDNYVFELSEYNVAITYTFTKKASEETNE